MIKIGVIGCGNMGAALIKGLVTRRLVPKGDLFCSDKDRQKLAVLRTRLGVHSVSTNQEIFKKCSVIIIAVKPRDIEALLRDFTLPFRDKLFISICAGVSIRRLEGYLGRVAVVRAMPNMPAVIAQGVTAVSLGRFAGLKDKKLALAIFSCIGEVIEVKEDSLDAVTAISGSGPAYFFYLVENLVTSAKKLGIPQRLAVKLVVKTALGSALLLQQSGQSARVLRKRVTSKGGTTEAAFNVFRKHRLDKALCSGFKAAAKRARELRTES